MAKPDKSGTVTMTVDFVVHVENIDAVNIDSLCMEIPLDAIVITTTSGDEVDAGVIEYETTDVTLNEDANDREPAEPCPGGKTRTVEYYRCWGGAGIGTGYWDTGFIDIPADTPDDQFDAAVRAAADKLEWRDEPPAFVGFYAAEDKYEDDDETED